jgi:hypothetical protein
MNTALLLMAQYNGQAVIPIDLVVKDFFSHLSTEKFVRKVSLGEINIPMIRIEASTQKSAKGVHINDLAAYIDARREAAVLPMVPGWYRCAHRKPGASEVASWDGYTFVTKDRQVIHFSLELQERKWGPSILYEDRVCFAPIDIRAEMRLDPS